MDYERNRVIDKERIGLLIMKKNRVIGYGRNSVIDYERNRVID